MFCIVFTGDNLKCKNYACMGLGHSIHYKIPFVSTISVKNYGTHWEKIGFLQKKCNFAGEGKNITKHNNINYV